MVMVMVMAMVMVMVMMLLCTGSDHSPVYLKLSQHGEHGGEAVFRGILPAISIHVCCDMFSIHYMVE